MYWLYNIIFTMLTPLIYLYFVNNKKKLDEDSFYFRAGIIDKSLQENLTPGKKRVWIHAVSVGEINGITSFVRELKKDLPEVDIIISTITATGQQVARENIQEASLFLYLPFDFFWAARRIMKIIKPHIFVTVETEIWPNMLREAKKNGAKVLMINGRISPRSVDKYRRVKPFISQVLKNYHLMSMIMSHDGERIKSIGAEEEKVVINGTSKYDDLVQKVKQGTRDKVYKVLNIDESKKIFIAGSTHEGEEEIILKVYKRLVKQYHNLLMIIVPRHIKRGQEIKKLAEEMGFSAILKTDIDMGKSRVDQKVIIINTIGELFDIYSIGDIIFCGASLVPRGGQNILEPAVWGKPVIYGPSMDDFIDACDLLEDAGAGIQIDGPDELYKQAINLISDENSWKEMGEKARKAVLSNRGASEKNVELIKELLKEAENDQKKVIR